MIKKLKSENGSSFPDAIIFILCFVVFVSFVVGIIEYFIPINKYNDMAEACRMTLMGMEKEGGLSASRENDLRTTLESQGLTVAIINASRNVKYGNDVSLRVEVTYTYSKLKFLKRENVTERFVYDKTVMQRKLVN